MFDSILSTLSNAFSAVAEAVKAAATAVATYVAGAAGTVWGWLCDRLPGICAGAVISVFITYAPWLALAASVAFLCYWVWTKHLDQTAKRQIKDAAYLGGSVLLSLALVTINALVITAAVCWVIG